MSLLRSVREKSENIKIQNVIQNYTLMLYGTLFVVTIT